MAINKVNYGGTTLIDTSGDTAEVGDVLAGETFHSKSGAQLTGTMTATSTPTANTIAKFDTNAHMNSTDMTSQEIDSFVSTVPSGFANLNNLSVVNNITAGGDITDGDGNVLSNVGTVYPFAWNKTSAGGSGSPITGEATLPAGTYIIIVQAPVISATTTMQISGISDKYFTASHNHETSSWVVTFNTATAIQLQMAQSGTVTFSYTERGGMCAIRII